MEIQPPNEAFFFLQVESCIKNYRKRKVYTDIVRVDRHISKQNQLLNI